MFMLAEGNILTNLVCDNTDCLSFIISFLDVMTVLFLAYCASFRVTKPVRIVGWVWAAVTIAATITIVAIHTCMFTLVSTLFTALVLMALFGVTFDSIVAERRGPINNDPPADTKPAGNMICPFATMPCLVQQRSPMEQPAPAAAVEQPVADAEQPVEEPVAVAEEQPVEEPVAAVDEQPAEESVVAVEESADDQSVAADATEAVQPAEATAEPAEETDDSDSLSLSESLAMARAATPASAVINKQYVASYLTETFGDEVICNTRGNYTKTGLPLADTHYAVKADGKKCFVYVYETDAAVVLLLCLPDEYAETIRNNGHKINKSAFPKSKDSWFSLVIDDSYAEDDVCEILKNACELAK